MIKSFFKKIMSFPVYGNNTAYAFLQAVNTKRTYYKRNGIKLDIHLTEHCNLNCKGCSHFSPLAEKEFADVDVFEKDLIRISELFDPKNIYGIVLVGGEPLLHPQVLDFVKIAYKHFPNNDRVIVTNGLLLLKQDDDFWNTLEETNTMIHITNYPISLKLDEIKSKTKSHNIFLHIEETVKTFKKYIFDFEGKQNIKMSHMACPDAFRCSQLNNGKLYPCHQPAYVHHFKKFFDLDLEVTEEDYIDIHTANSSDEIVKFLSSPIPFCRYCNLKARQPEYEWGRSKKELSEWAD